MRNACATRFLDSEFLEKKL